MVNVGKYSIHGAFGNEFFPASVKSDGETTMFPVGGKRNVSHVNVFFFRTLLISMMTYDD